MASLKNTTKELRDMLEERIKLQGGSKRWSNPLNAISTTVTGAFSDLSQTFVEKTSGLTNGDINKVWRAKILVDRLGGPATGRIAGLPRDNGDYGKSTIPNKIPNQKVCQAGGYPTPNLNSVSKETWRKELQEGLLRPNGVDGERFENLPLDAAPHKTVTVSRSSKDRKDLHNRASQHKRNEVIIFNLAGSESGYQYIILQNRPPEIEVQGETSWATIKSFGRNLPMYHFTGAEDKIQLQVSWFCNDPGRPWEVIQKCRLLEAWSKADGYYAGPPILQIDWGGSGLFSNAYFILTSAAYILKNFRDGYMDRRSDNSQWVDGKLYPMAATQELVFTRVSGTNPLHSQIYDPSKLAGLSGVGCTEGDKLEVNGINTVDTNTLWQTS